MPCHVLRGLVARPVLPRLAMTGPCGRVLRAGGPALGLQHPAGHRMPVPAHLLGTPGRGTSGLGSTLGLEVASKWPARRSANAAGRAIALDAAVQARMDGFFRTVGF